MEHRAEIEQLLLDVLGGNFDLVTEKASKIIDILDAAPEADQVPLLAFILSIGNLAPDSDFTDKGRRMADERFQELSRTIRGEALKVFHVWIRKNPTEEYLAQKIWAYQKRFQKDDERDFFLAALFKDRHMPYVQIPDDIYSIEDIDGLPETVPTGDVNREVMALIMNLLNRGPADKDILAVALWNVMSRQLSSFNRFQIFRIILHVVRTDAENAVRMEMVDIIEDAFNQFVEGVKSHGVLGVAIDAKNMPKELRELIEKLIMR